MRTRNSIVREYSNGIADAFLSDLTLAEERKQGPVIDSENALLDAFRAYISDPTTVFKVA